MLYKEIGYSAEQINIRRILQITVTQRDSKENTCKNRGVDECNTWGDYFYMEALTRMITDWKLYW